MLSARAFLLVTTTTTAKLQGDAVPIPPSACVCHLVSRCCISVPLLSPPVPLYFVCLSLLMCFCARVPPCSLSLLKTSHSTLLLSLCHYHNYYYYYYYYLTRTLTRLVLPYEANHHTHKTSARKERAPPSLCLLASNSPPPLFPPSCFTLPSLPNPPSSYIQL